MCSYSTRMDAVTSLRSQPVSKAIRNRDQERLKEGDEIIIGPYKTLRTLKDGDQVKREAAPVKVETKS